MVLCMPSLTKEGCTELRRNNVHLLLPMPQLHRNEKVIAQTGQTLRKQAFGVDYVLMNVPNQYLKG